MRGEAGSLGGLLDRQGSRRCLHGVPEAEGVFGVGELADQGAGHPDFGLYTAGQVQRGLPREGQVPERGVVEVKSVSGTS